MMHGVPQSSVLGTILFIVSLMHARQLLINEYFYVHMHVGRSLSAAKQKLYCSLPK